MPTNTNQKKKPVVSRVIAKQSFRDHRKFSDVLQGKKPNPPKVEGKGNIIPISFTLNVVENIETSNMLEHGLIAENSAIIDPKKVKSDILACVPEIKGVFSLSPTKVLIVFGSKHEADSAVAVDSALWNVFDDIRVWSEGEYFDDHIVCLECFGIHPKCWSVENVRRIGKKWGPVLSIE